MRNAVLFLLCFYAFYACRQEPKEQWQPLELLEWGLPITILAPDSAVVKATDLGVMKDVTVKGQEDFSIQIYASDAETTDIARIKADQLNEVKNNRYFSKIINEEEAGFIYETKIDSANINYGFRYIRVQGDVEYIFQTSLVGSYTQEQVERMYNAVKPQK